MARTELPETDLRRVAAFCAAMWPPEYHDEVRAEFHVRGMAVTLCELRVPWDGEGEWMHEPFARLRYRPISRDWALYWADRHSRWHEHHEGNVFAGTMARLLREVDEDPTCIFKG